MTPTAPRRALRYPVVAAITAALVLAGCSAGVDGSPTGPATALTTTPATATGDPLGSRPAITPGSQSPASRPAASTSASNPEPASSEIPAGPEIVEHAADVDLPRILHYAGAEITAVAAVVSNAAPSSWGTDKPLATDRMHLFLSIETSFADGYPGSDSRLPVDRFHLITADGSSIPAKAPSSDGEVPIPADGTASDLLVFAIDPALVAAARLSYDDGEHIPALVPLTGPVADSPYPIEAVPGSRATTDFATGCDPSPADVVLDAVAWDLDAGVGHDPDARLIQGKSSRAANGTRWVRIQATVTAQAGQCGGTFVNHEQFTMDADGKVIHPSNDTSVKLGDGESATVSHVFAVPEGVAKLSLLVGDADAEPHAFGLTVPADLP